MGAAVVALVSVLSVGSSAQSYSAQAFSFVGTAAQCSPAPAGNKIITSSWLNGSGLPDNGTANPGGPTPHQGLLLSKNGPSPNCSAAGADIVNWGIPNTPTTLTALGFDYRRGGHCNNGAPRINVYSGAMSFLALGIKIPLGLARAVVAVVFGVLDPPPQPSCVKNAKAIVPDHRAIEVRDAGARVEPANMEA